MLYGPYRYTREVIEFNAPDAPGVYLTSSVRDLRGDVYVGQSINIRRRLLKHVGSGQKCINLHSRWFSFEIAEGGEIAREEHESRFTNMYDPICDASSR